MKKLLLSVMVALAALGMNAQTKKGEGSLMGSLGYQTNYERFGLQAQGRYVIADNLRIAPDLTFFFPKISDGIGCKCKLSLCLQFQ